MTDDETAVAPLSFVDIWHAHHDASVRLAWLLTGDAAGAEDIVADAMVKVYRRWQRDVIDRPAAYIRRAVVNQCNSRLRRRYLERDHAARRHGDHRGRLAHDDRAAIQDEVWQAMQRLPRRQRQCLVLRYWADLTVADIAATLAVSEGTVKSSLSRGLARLEQWLGRKEQS